MSEFELYNIPDEMLREIIYDMTLEEIVNLRLVSKRWNDIISDDRFWCALLKYTYDLEKNTQCIIEYKKLYKIENDIYEFWDIINTEKTKSYDLITTSKPEYNTIFESMLHNLDKLERMYKVYLAFETFFLKLMKDSYMNEETLISFHKYIVSLGSKTYIQMIKNILKDPQETFKDIQKIVSGFAYNQNLIYLPFSVNITKFDLPIKNKETAKKYLKILWRDLKSISTPNITPNPDNLNTILFEKNNKKWLESKGDIMKNVLYDVDNFNNLLNIPYDA
jgi:hypothetical protein